MRSSTRRQREGESEPSRIGLAKRDHLLRQVIALQREIPMNWLALMGIKEKSKRDRDGHKHIDQGRQNASEPGRGCH